MTPTSTMAVRIFEHGDPQVLTYGEYPLPALGSTDVLVTVDTASVSGWDLKYRRGLAPHTQLPGRTAFPLPQQLGREAAGVVSAIGAEVTRYRPGDRVVAVVHPENPNSPEALRGLGNLSTGIDIPGHQAPGAYAQHLVRDQNLWLPVPDNIDLEQAALALWPFSTAHRLLRDRLQVHLADTVLIHGASGGMGQATVQLARLQGAHVIATTRNPAKTAQLHELGADNVVITDDLATAAEQIRNHTAGQGADHAIDYTANRNLLRLSLDTLRLGGSICPAAGDQDTEPLPISTSDLTRLELNLYGIRGARHIDAITVLELLQQQRIHTPVAARFPLRHADQAHTHLETTADLIGRIVLKP